MTTSAERFIDSSRDFHSKLDKWDEKYGWNEGASWEGFYGRIIHTGETGILALSALGSLIWYPAKELGHGLAGTSNLVKWGLFNHYEPDNRKYRALTAEHFAKLGMGATDLVSQPLVRGAMGIAGLAGIIHPAITPKTRHAFQGFHEARVGWDVPLEEWVKSERTKARDADWEAKRQESNGRAGPFSAELSKPWGDADGDSPSEDKLEHKQSYRIFSWEDMDMWDERYGWNRAQSISGRVVHLTYAGMNVPKAVLSIPYYTLKEVKRIGKAGGSWLAYKATRRDPKKQKKWEVLKNRYMGKAKWGLIDPVMAPVSYGARFVTSLGALIHPKIESKVRKKFHEAREWREEKNIYYEKTYSIHSTNFRRELEQVARPVLGSTKPK